MHECFNLISIWCPRSEKRPKSTLDFKGHREPDFLRYHFGWVCPLMVAIVVLHIDNITEPSPRIIWPFYSERTYGLLQMQLFDVIGLIICANIVTITITISIMIIALVACGDWTWTWRAWRITPSSFTIANGTMSMA